MSFNFGLSRSAIILGFLARPWHWLCGLFSRSGTTGASRPAPTTVHSMTTAAAAAAVPELTLVPAPSSPQTNRNSLDSMPIHSSAELSSADASSANTEEQGTPTNHSPKAQYAFDEIAPDKTSPIHSPLPSPLLQQSFATNFPDIHLLTSFQLNGPTRAVSDEVLGPQANEEDLLSSFCSVQSTTSYVEVKETTKQKQQQALHYFMYGEYLGHHLAYQQNNPLYPDETYIYLPSEVFESSQLPAFDKQYQIQKIYPQDQGLVAMLLIPVNLKKGEPADIKVLFRGTKDAASAVRDCEVGGPGHESIELQKAKLLGAVSKAIGEIQSDHAVSITCAGHSLGGADAQNMTVFLLNALAELKEYNTTTTGLSKKELAPFARVKKLNLHIQNAAGIPQKNKNIADGCAAFLNTLGHQLEIDCHINYHKGDLVQRTGEAHLFQEKDPRLTHVNVRRRMLYVSSVHALSQKTSFALSLATSIAIGSMGTLIMPVIAMLAAATISTMSTLSSTREIIQRHTFKAFKAIEETWMQALEAAAGKDGSEFNILDDADPDDANLISQVLSDKAWQLDLAHKLFFGKADPTYVPSQLPSSRPSTPSLTGQSSRDASLPPPFRAHL